MTTALVTGGNRGIGKEVCRQLAGAGHHVILTARRAETAENAARDLGRGGLDVTPLVLDVTDPDSVAGAAQQVPELDVLVNNAGILYDTWQTATTADLATVHEALETNTSGPWRCIQAFLPQLRRSTHARVVNVSSGSGAFENLSGATPAYSVSKVALNALTVMLAAELRRDGILVNAVCPGYVNTDMGGPGGRPVAEGARGVVWATALPDNGPTGGFFRDGKRLEF
ncbi:SDR family NAD(P)-dependent oxidoreductase [Streptomyces caelestis]|uniref:SDR family NAD(P)-dependent oxidoreductase n=1 Tax=Streptomyces caelestis TaxID=36816 RepID=UPI0036FF38DF